VLEGAEDYCLRGGPVESVGVLAPDEHTVEFRLVTPAPYFLNVLNRPDGGPQREDAILSGPWRVEHAGQDSLILGADPNNVRPRRGNVVRLAIRCDAPERAAELYAGGAVDLITADGPLDDYALIVDEPQIGAATATNYIVANCSTADGADVEFRRALAHAVDRNAIEAMLPPNYVIARGGIVPPALHGHTPDIAPAFDVAAARHALAHSSVRGVVGLGVPGGNPSSVSPPPIFTTTAGQRILKLLVEGWNEVLRPEVRIELQALRDAGRTRRTAEDPALVASGWLPGYPDPEYYLRLLLHSESHSNVGSFSDPQFDELIDRARRQTTGSARLQLFHEADRRAIRESCALIPLYYRRPAVFVKPWVEGWWEWGKSSSAVADLMVRRP
jgi:oligopeptide transport system substrate-binding protein